ncbi:winged helix-turn-helix transcriptional regulator [Candidatus Frankia nodulisporulans]|uniref:winged helix-turn-helix transcriptional regulator n=1 Tax=Candidatus Frankia nodulisporulans TaxID=2060052 RepID=UPI001FD47AC4|nr:winged helix-turn-helix transcriptional regulator [Candidatus Frankia nodulisporulans]
MPIHSDYCPIALGVEILGDRWTPLVIRELMAGAEGFNDIHRGLPRMSRTLLTGRLRALERHGLVRREVAERGRPGRYVLTEAGQALTPIVWSLGQWAAEWVFDDPDDGDYELVLSDWLFRMPSLYLAEAQIAAGGRAHVYELTWSAPGLGGVLGACHGLDVPLVFGNLTSGQPAVLLGEEPSAAAVALSADMRAAWTGFATHGDPGWPGYEPDRRRTRIFDTPTGLVDDPERASRLIWKDPPSRRWPCSTPEPGMPGRPGGGEDSRPDAR